MNELVGKALEEDEAFYNGIFGEGESEDDDFEASSLGKDSFDSDFDQTEKSDSQE